MSVIIIIIIIIIIINCQWWCIFVKPGRRSRDDVSEFVSELRTRNSPPIKEMWTDRPDALEPFLKQEALQNVRPLSAVPDRQTMIANC